MSRLAVGWILVLAWAPALSQDLPKPGLYATNVVLGSPGLVMDEVYAEEECLTTDDFVRGPDNYVSRRDDSTCVVAEYIIGDGKVSMKLSCEFTGMSASIVGVGVVGEDSFKVDNDVKTVVAGLEVDLKAILTGQYLEDCPEEAAADASDEPPEATPDA